MRHARSYIALVAIAILCVGPTCTKALSHQQLDISGVSQLLAVMRTAKAVNLGYEEVVKKLQALPEQPYEQLLDSLIAANAAKRELADEIDSLTHSPTYQFYYRHFKNMTPDMHRRILLALPFGVVPSPADISRNLFQTSQRLDSIGPWVDSALSKIDLAGSRNIAATWLPPGNFVLPQVYFFLDGNGDAFALDNAIGFDVYSLVLRPYVEGSAPAPSTETPAQQVELTLAHELHHVYASRFLSAEPAERDDWKLQWRNRLIRAMTSEGTAMHCHPPAGVSRSAKEDTAIVAFWIRELNTKMRTIRNGQLDQTAAYAWRDSTSWVFAIDLLRFHLAKTYQGEELERQLVAHAQDRPMLIYTLGWWMTSRLSRNGAAPQAIQSLVTNPLSIIEKYNRTLPAGADSLRINL